MLSVLIRLSEDSKQKLHPWKAVDANTHSLFAVDLDTAISDIVSIDCLHSYSQDQRKLYDFV